MEMAQRSVNIYNKLDNNHRAALNNEDFNALLKEASTLFFFPYLENNGRRINIFKYRCHYCYCRFNIVSIFI
jgi:hypothetical protein